ncbi:MAG: flagellar motor protein MotB [Butyricicoccus sp.]|nr:OmpA family protein [Butyricicoccus pullicaecorum]
MARRKRDKGGGFNGPNWLDTYADMVTLLLCFFVLLVATADTNKEKWAILVKSLNPDGDPSQIVDMMAENPGEYAVNGGVDKPVDMDATDRLYYALKQYISQSNLDQTVSITKGDTYEFVTFDSTVFFQPNSYVIQKSGKQVLDGMANILKTMGTDIDEIRILGHTSQASAEMAYDLHHDRFLASNRADSVLLYLQDKNIIDPAKLVSVGYGQYRPIAGFDTAEGRSKNRRVEMIISTRQEGKDSAIDEYYQTRETKAEEATSK